MPDNRTDFPETTPSDLEVVQIIDGVSKAVPRDLVKNYGKPTQLPQYARGKETLGMPGVSENSRSATSSFVGFKAVTNDYGQLKSILDANNGNEIDSLVVAGPMNGDDFRAIWDCAVYGNMLVLNLENATMENNAIPDYALYDPIQFDTGFWLRLKRIMLPEGIVSIGKAAFPFMGLEKINIPSTVREIGSTAFGYDRWLNCEIIIPEGVEEIKYQTFNECNRLTIAPSLPSSLRKIGEHAFSMTRFDGLEFPDGLEEIGQGAFQDCNLSCINLPDACTTIGDMAFQLSANIKEIKFPRNLESIPDGLFSMCNGLEKLTIHDNCRHIGSSAFMMCENLHEVVFNQGLETIGTDAFFCCSMETLDLPPSLKKLGSKCLVMGWKLREVRCAAKIPPVCEENPSDPGYGPFYPQDETEEITLYVPYGTKDTYSTTWGWDCFNEIIETDDFQWSGIADILPEGLKKDTPVYTLNGQQAHRLQQGQIYICNGKKFIYNCEINN